MNYSGRFVSGRIPIFLIASVVFFVSELGISSIVVPWEDHPVHDYYDLLFSNIVVCGKVVEVTSILVPIKEVQNDVPSHLLDRFVKLTKVTLLVSEVMKGYQNPKEIAFAFRYWVKKPKLLKEGAQIITGL